jgi:hypothetical protein
MLVWQAAQMRWKVASPMPGGGCDAVSCAGAAVGAAVPGTAADAVAAKKLENVAAMASRATREPNKRICNIIHLFRQHPSYRTTAPPVCRVLARLVRQEVKKPFPLRAALAGRFERSAMK